MGIRRSTGDLFALALPAGEAVGRIGCHLNGCCYGEKCDAPWAVWQHGAWRYPAQLLSSATAAATFGFLLWLSKDSPSPSGSSWRGGWGERLREGDLFRVYLLLFGVTRFALEFVRWRESTMAGLSPMQWFCLDLVAIALVGLLRRKKDGLPQLQGWSLRARVARTAATPRSPTGNRASALVVLVVCVLPLAAAGACCVVTGIGFDPASSGAPSGRSP